MNKENGLTLHQVLHGYSEGHRLLGSSLKLSKEAQRTMLVQSDMSGPRMTEEFKEYLSGYSLPSDKYYVFSKTWFAPEMDRPGCVWTHSILIDFDQLNYINDLNLLAEYFIRPEQNLYNPYQDKLTVSIKETGQVTNKKEETHHEIINKFILILFNNSKEITPCVLTANGPTKYEGDILGIWSLLWPEVKASFSFSSGSLAPRTINDKPFDLQISPEKIANHFLRYESNIIIIEDNPSKINYPDWVRYASNQMIQSKNSFWEYANIFSAAIYDFRQLIEISLYKNALANNKLIFNDLIEILYKKYPSPNEGTFVKVFFFSPDFSKFDSDQSFEKKCTTIRNLVTTPHFKMFPLKEFEMKNWAKILLDSISRKDHTYFLNDLINKNLNVLGLKLFKELISILTSKDLNNLYNHNPDIIGKLISLNPAIASQGTIWSNPKYDQVELLSIFARSPFLKTKNIVAVINSILENKAYWLLTSLHDYFGETNSATLLLWLNKKNNIHFQNEDFSSILSKFPDRCLEFLNSQKNVHPLLIALITSVLNPRDEIVKNYGPDLWIKAIHSITKFKFDSKSVEDEIKLEISQFLLPFAFVNPYANFDRLVTFSFPIIHKILSEGSIDYKFWRTIAPILPEISWYFSWDKCEQLRLGLIDQFIKNKWSYSEFLECTIDPELFRSVIKSALSKYRGKKFIKELAREINSDEVKATKFQILELQKIAPFTR